MATINLIPNKRKTNPIHRKKSDSNLPHSLIYNTKHWEVLRINYLVLNPICEQCKKALAIDVHHIMPISTGRNESEIKRLGFDVNNLKACCKACHKEIHYKLNNTYY